MVEPTPTPQDRAHVFPLRVYYEDTDAAGIVYYANYLKFTERARTELLRALGSEQPALMAEAGVGFAVRRCEVDYLKPARLDDAIEVHTRLLAAGGASMEALQIVRRPHRDGIDDLARVRVRIACVDRAGRPARLPPGLRRRLAALSGA
jgi:acyl-CoA thioester hydrolase